MSSYDLKRVFGCRALHDWRLLKQTGTGLHVIHEEKPPLTIGDMATINRNNRGKLLDRPKMALHTVCMDIGYGDGTSPGGYKYKYDLTLVDFSPVPERRRRTAVANRHVHGSSSPCRSETAHQTLLVLGPTGGSNSHEFTSSSSYWPLSQSHDQRPRISGFSGARYTSPIKPSISVGSRRHSQARVPSNNPV
jgi:hypothetical protein